MVKEAARKCSHCGNNGHNSRTCHKSNCFKLFGVNIPDQAQEQKSSSSLERSESMGNLPSDADVHVDDSDGHVHSKRGKAACERRRGNPWTDEEHRRFLAGLRSLGKGDWRGIARNFVCTRSPAQVASHAQKFFLRLSVSNEIKNRRASLFDMPYNESANVSDLTSRISNLWWGPTFPMTANSNIGSYSGIPYMFRAPSNGQIFPTVSPYVEAMPTYFYMPRDIENITTYANFTAHPSGIPYPPYSFSRRELEAIPAKSTEKDSLELKIGPFNSPQRTDMSSQVFEEDSV